MNTTRKQSNEHHLAKRQKKEKQKIILKHFNQLKWNILRQQDPFKLALRQMPL